jgi:hypothetical protein
VCGCVPVVFFFAFLAFFFTTFFFLVVFFFATFFLAAFFLVAFFFVAFFLVTFFLAAFFFVAFFLAACADGASSGSDSGSDSDSDSAADGSHQLLSPHPAARLRGTPACAEQQTAAAVLCATRQATRANGGQRAHEAAECVNRVPTFFLTTFFFAVFFLATFFLAAFFTVCTIMQNQRRDAMGTESGPSASAVTEADADPRSEVRAAVVFCPPLIHAQCAGAAPTFFFAAFLAVFFFTTCTHSNTRAHAAAPVSCRRDGSPGLSPRRSRRSRVTRVRVRVDTTAPSPIGRQRARPRRRAARLAGHSWPCAQIAVHEPSSLPPSSAQLSFSVQSSFSEQPFSELPFSAQPF